MTYKIVLCMCDIRCPMNYIYIMLMRVVQYMMGLLISKQILYEVFYILRYISNKNIYNLCDLYELYGTKVGSIAWLNCWQYFRFIKHIIYTRYINWNKWKLWHILIGITWNFTHIMWLDLLNYKICETYEIYLSKYNIIYKYITKIACTAYVSCIKWDI